LPCRVARIGFGFGALSSACFGFTKLFSNGLLFRQWQIQGKKHGKVEHLVSILNAEDAF